MIDVESLRKVSADESYGYIYVLSALGEKDVFFVCEGGAFRITKPQIEFLARLAGTGGEGA